MILLLRISIACILFFKIQFSYADYECFKNCSCVQATCQTCSDDLNTCVQNCKGGISLCDGGPYCCDNAGDYTCAQSASCNGNSWQDCLNANINNGQGIIYKNGSFALCQQWQLSSCDTSCRNASLIQSKSWFSITGRVVQCVKETLNLVFFSPQCHSAANLLPMLQKNLKNAVYIMMVLYVVLTGIKLTISPQEFNKRQFFTFILKIVLVFYFSVGLEYKGKTQDGLVDIVYKGGLSAMESFSGFVLKGAINNGLCQYKTSDYEPGFGYLAIWDSLDCRVAYYLGMGRLFIAMGEGDKNLYNSISNSNEGTGKAIGEGVAFGLAQIIIPLLLALEIIESLVIIVFGVLVLSLAVYFVHFYIICMLGLTVATYLGVIMVPLSLYGYTKQFFDNWVTVIFSYVIQPCIIVAMCSLMFMAMDSIIYPGCSFESAGLWAWQMSTPISSECHNSLGGQLYNTLVNAPAGSVTSSWDSFFFPITVIGDKSYWTALVSGFLRLIFFSYLFLMFAEGAGDLAAQLTSGPDIGELAGSAGAVFNNFLKKMSKRPGGEKQSGGGGPSGPSVSGKARQGINVSSK